MCDTYNFTVKDLVSLSLAWIKYQIWYNFSTTVLACYDFYFLCFLYSYWFMYIFIYVIFTVSTCCFMRNQDDDDKR